MHGSVSFAPELSTFTPAASGEEFRVHKSSAISGEDGFAWFGEMVRKLRWTKPAYTLHCFTGAPESTCEKQVRGVAMPSATVLRDVLRSTEGGVVLDYIMGGSTAKWWRVLEQDRKIAKLGREFYDAAQHEMQFR